MITDWQSLALSLGSLSKENPDIELGGSHYAQLALEEILGMEWIEKTVEYAISFRPGAELAMNCLRLITSEKAAKYAYSLYKTTDKREEAVDAVWLIKHLAVPESYVWLEEFLMDEKVVDYGLDILDQLLIKEKIDYSIEKKKVHDLFLLADKTSKGRLMDKINFIKNYLGEG